MFLTAADLLALTGYRRGAEQCRWLTANGVEHTVSQYTGRPIVRWSAVGVKEPPVEQFVPPPLDDAAVYLPLEEIRSRKRILTKGMDTPETGVYFLFFDDDLLYVGLSNNVYWRLWAHFVKCVDYPSKAIRFNHVTVISVPECWLKTVESFYIKREKPPRNIKGVWS